MKTKFLAITLCLAMLFSVVLPMGVSAEETEIPDGTIAITEICPSPDDDRFEFVEVMNASDVEINLKNYTVARFGFDHRSNKWFREGLRQLMGWGDNHLRELNALTLTQDVALKKNEVAVLWFVYDDEANNSLTEADFKAYWESKGNDMTDVTVVKVVHSASTGYICTDNATNFLPGVNAGVVISMIKTAKCPETVGQGTHNWADLSNKNVTDTKITEQETSNLHQLADCIAPYFTVGDTTSGTADSTKVDFVNSRNYYGFVDQAAHLAEAEKQGITLTGNDGTTYTTMVIGDGDPIVKKYTSDVTGASTAYYVEDGEKELPTPGALRDGQFAVSTDLGVYAAQYRTDGDTQSVRFVGYVEGTDYTEVGFWINATYTDGGNKVTKSLKVLATQTVYQNITAGGKTVGVSEATNETYSEGYLMAIAVSGLPLENTTNITFYVTPYGITADGRTVVGSQVTHTLQNSAS